jgi:outer membrane immunogenic protein
MRKPCRAIATASAWLAMSLAAEAADLPIRRPPIPAYAPLAFNWTGFYIGGNVGGAWAGRNVTDSFNGLDFNTGNNGVFIGGAQLGGNLQFGAFVVGVEWDFDWAATSNSPTGGGVVVASLGGNIVQVTANDQWITTLAARFGAAIDRVLLYAKVGGGWVGNNDFIVANLTTGVSIVGTADTTASGWLVGAGVEWAFAGNWTVKVEYDYLALGDWTFVVPATAPFLAGDSFTNSNRHIQMVKVGFNYLLNWSGPVAARY